MSISQQRAVLSSPRVWRLSPVEISVHCAVEQPLLIVVAKPECAISSELNEPW
jgi:hypothetical protein